MPDLPLTLAYSFENNVIMKTQRCRPVKTEESVEKVEEGKKDKKDWVFHSLLKNRKKTRTPLRFADVIHQQNKQLESTHAGSTD